MIGKHKRLSFHIGRQVTCEALRNVHADLCGSLNVTPSLSGKQFFLSIIDDYTRKVWIYFLAAKGEAFSKFCEWKKLVENLVKMKVCRLRTDNRFEFCNAEFDNFCKHLGIKRHMTCAYTPQQHGVAERVNKTLMEKVRCFLVESSLEEQF